jgi:hypothetical protein
VQRCQASGRQVLLSVKADGLEAVGGNANFGNSDTPILPLGPVFGTQGVDAEGDGGMKKRQDDTLPYPPFPILNLTLPVPISASAISATATPISASGAPLSTATSIPIIEPGPVFPPSTLDPTTPFPNLFDERHPPSSLDLTLFSLFGEGHTERADLRPLDPDVPSPASPAAFNGTNWITPSSSMLSMMERPLGEEIVVDGYDIQVPVQWKGTYQDARFKDQVVRLRELNRQAWIESGGVEGRPGDLGADGGSVVYFGWVGEVLKREAGVTFKGEGWVEWDSGI